MNENINNPDYKKITPFKGWVMENFPFIEADFDAITNYQLLSKMIEYLNQVIYNENLTESKMLELITAFNNLKSYIDNYFATTDFQEQIDRKLDQLVANGTLEEMLSTILNEYKVEFNAQLNDMQDEIAYQTNRINQVTNGSPLVANGVIEMTDTSKIYLNIVDGKLYYYNTSNSAWTIFGTYQAPENSTLVNNMWDTFDKTNDYNLFDTNARIPHAYLTTSGNISYVDDPESSTYSMTVSDKIQVSNYEYIVFNYMKPTTFCFYNADDTLLERVAGSSASLNTAFSTTRDNTLASYIRVSYNTASTSYPFDKALIYATTDTTDTTREYVPFNNIIMKQSHLPILSAVFKSDFEPNFYPAGIRRLAWRGITYAYNPTVQYNQPYAPENSFPAYRKAIEEKMDMIWIAAVRYSSDGVFYCMHDATTGRTCTTDLEVATSTSTQLDQVRLRQVGWNTWSDADLVIPKLEDVIKLACQHKINIGFRMGALPGNLLTQENISIWNSFFELIDRYNLKDCIYSGTMNQCLCVNTLKPDFFVTTTGSSSNTENDNIQLINDIYNAGFKRKAVVLYNTALTENVMMLAHSKDVYVLGVSNEPIISEEMLNQYLNLCVDGIITHYPIEIPLN